MYRLSDDGHQVRRLCLRCGYCDGESSRVILFGFSSQNDLWDLAETLRPNYVCEDCRADD